MLAICVLTFAILHPEILLNQDSDRNELGSPKGGLDYEIGLDGQFGEKRVKLAL